MNSEKEGDYRAALSNLMRAGYKIKHLAKVAKMMLDEQGELREEARAAHQLKSHHPYKPGIDGP